MYQLTQYVLDPVYLYVLREREKERERERDGMVASGYMNLDIVLSSINHSKKGRFYTIKQHEHIKLWKVNLLSVSYSTKCNLFLCFSPSLI